MKGKKIAGIILFVVGLIVLILSLAADFIAIGLIGASPGFGLRQIVGTIVGVVIAAVGLVLMIKK